MKRERNSPTPSPPLLTPPSSSPLTTPKSNKKQKRQAPTQSSPSAKQDLEAKISGGWTPENKSKLVALIFEAGLASIKLDEVALLTGLTKKQIGDATCRGRNNLRQKMIELAATAPACGSSRKGKGGEDI